MNAPSTAPVTVHVIRMVDAETDGALELELESSLVPEEPSPPAPSPRRSSTPPPLPLRARRSTPPPLPIHARRSTPPPLPRGAGLSG